MKYFFLLLLPLILLAQPARADGAKDVFIAFNKCLITSKPAQCRGFLTADSLELYDRVSGYDVMDCMPKKTDFVSEQPLGEYEVIKAQTQVGDTVRPLKMYFTKEEDSWKLDLPYSLRVSMGENWEKQVKMTEQIYLVLRAQLQGKIDCTAVQNLAAGSPAKFQKVHATIGNGGLMKSQ